MALKLSFCSSLSAMCPEKLSAGNRCYDSQTIMLVLLPLRIAESASVLAPSVLRYAIWNLNQLINERRGLRL